jgi:hypothetical protein
MHILTKVIADDGNPANLGTVSTLLKWGDLGAAYAINSFASNTGNVQVTISKNDKNPGILQISDVNLGSTVNTIPYNSNILGNRVIIHEVDKYLQYKWKAWKVNDEINNHHPYISN